jgi:hypothetical protein
LQDALIPSYPVIEDDGFNHYKRHELEYFL